MVSNIPIQLLLVQLSNMYIDPENYNINFTTPNTNTTIGIVHFTKDQLLDAKRIQDLETENHMLSTELNMTTVLLHKAEENNQRLRHEQIRNRVRKVLLRNATSQYIQTKKELDSKIVRLAQVETMLKNAEKELVHVKQESNSWRRKYEQYENKILEVVEGGLGKKAAKLEAKEADVETIKENCNGGSCEMSDGKRTCMGDKSWCCWLENATGGMQDNAVQTETTENDEEKCKELSLVEASKMNYVTIISQLLENETYVQTSLPKSPLHWATENAHYDACKLLVENNANVNARDSDDFNATPVHVAAELGLIPILELFLEQAEVDVDAQDVDGWAPLHWAVTFNQTPAVVLLLENGANVDITDNEGKTPLHHAALNGNVQIIRQLVKKKADVNANDNEGRTPLHFATLSNHFNASSNATTFVLQPMINDSTLANNPCKILRRYMTSPKIRDKSLHFTKMNHQTHAVHSSVPAKVLALCLDEHDCTEMVRILVNNGANPLAKDKRGVTPFDGAPPECRGQLDTWNLLQKKITP